jgi:multisubunit Na+/H+ antiporter MnhB subunit
MRRMFKNWGRKKNLKNQNILWIILGLLFIFIVGYAFWNSSKTTSTASPGAEPNNLEQLKKLLSSKKRDLENAIKELEQAIKRRRKYFFWTRLILVTLIIVLFLCLEYYWKFGPFQKCHFIDNLRNYLSFIVILFTTLAFVAKGNLKSFKESIEDMAINLFFKKEQELKSQIQTLNLEIASIEQHIKNLESK